MNAAEEHSAPSAKYWYLFTNQANYGAIIFTVLWAHQWTKQTCCKIKNQNLAINHR